MQTSHCTTGKNQVPIPLPCMSEEVGHDEHMVHCSYQPASTSHQVVNEWCRCNKWITAWSHHLCHMSNLRMHAQPPPHACDTVPPHTYCTDQLRNSPRALIHNCYIPNPWRQCLGTSSFQPQQQKRLTNKTGKGYNIDLSSYHCY